MANFLTFQIWYARSLAQNTFANAEADRKIENTTGDEGIQLLSCRAARFLKRNTDTSQATASDKTSPDTGTAGSYIHLSFVQKRKTRNAQVLSRLEKLFFLKNNDVDFNKGRIGLENSDNPELNVLPTANAGYKLMSFMQRPTDDNPGVNIFELELEFLGDHTELEGWT